MTHPQAPAPREPIPEDVIAAARIALIHAHRNPEYEPDTVLLLAHAIMAERTAQRKRDAEIAVARSDHKRAHCDDACVCDNGYHVALAIMGEV